MRPSKVFLAALLATILLSTPAQSADGVVEINQACALSGCYSGDAPGFPVFIKEPGSYRLTGNLDLSGTPDTTAIQITTSFVTLDLNGFEIKGAITCTGSGATLDCPPSGVGWAVLGEEGIRAVTVRNGTVRNMGRGGIEVRGDALTVSDIRAIHNRLDGIAGEANALVINSIAIENGDDGFDFDTGSVLKGVTAMGNGNDGIEIDGPNAVVDGASSQGNGNRGYKLSHSSKFSRSVSGDNVSTDTCGGGVCSESKRYYLTTINHNGSTADTACAVGFHMATLDEIFETANLQYDFILGATVGDSGMGAPRSEIGWIRSGELSHTLINCGGWVFSLPDDLGTSAGLAKYYDWNNTATPMPWFGGNDHSCDSLLAVWCAED